MIINHSYNNKPDWYVIIAFSSISITLCAFGLIRFYLYSTINFLLLSLTISIFVEISLFIREFINRPKIIEINENHIILKFRFRSEEKIDWTNIKKIYCSELWQGVPFFGKIGSGGAIVTKEFPKGVLLNLEILKIIRDLFYLKYGHDPETIIEKY